MQLSDYSFGIGDRFGKQGKAQLEAIQAINEKLGIQLSPVWNKSNREHQIIGTEPEDVRKEADEAVNALNFRLPYFVDADHINLSNVEKYIPYADFFTIDVADFIGQAPDDKELGDFIATSQSMKGQLSIPGIEKPFEVNSETIESIGKNYLSAIQKARKVYEVIASNKDECVIELSMDEVAKPQSPIEMLFILKLAGQYEIPVQTIAPKFSGSFFKGIDYIGNVAHFKKEFEEDLMVIDYAVRNYGLPENLKLSVHSGSDKFSIYPVMGQLIQKHGKGIHVKTAGTTWLEEVIGLALSGEEGLTLVREFYGKGFAKMNELEAPYASVIQIDRSKLPQPSEVNRWSGEKFARTLRHIPRQPDFNPHFRQFIHIAYKLAAGNLREYYRLLEKHEAIVSKQVYENIYERHLMRLFNG